MDRTAIHQGQRVLTRDGERLGHIVAVGDEVFHVSKGFYPHEDFRARFSDVDAVRDDEVVLRLRKEDLREDALGQAERD